MGIAPSIKLVSYHSAGPKEQQAGLLGWLCIEIGAAFVVDGVGLRRTRDGRLTFSYPARSDSRGRRHAIIRPMDEASRLAIETNLLKQLGLEPGKPESR